MLLQVKVVIVSQCATSAGGRILENTECDQGLVSNVAK